MMTNRDSWSDTRGMALYAALGMLAIFSLMGISFVTYMMTELDGTKYDVSQVRAHQLSNGGVYAAIGELELALNNNGATQDAYAFKLNAYRYNIMGERSVYPQEVQVDVNDESGKVNLNKAPNDVLVALGLPEAKVVALKKQATQRPLVSVDDLYNRKFLSSGEFKTVRTQHSFTVYGDGTININAASPAVLAAVFALTPEEAAALAAKRPFTSWEDALVKVGKDSWSFNVPTRVPVGAQIPAGLSLQSTCFRLYSSVDLAMTTNEFAKTYPSQTEAVVSIDAGGESAIQFWTETSNASVAVELEASVEEETDDGSVPEAGAEEIKKEI